MTQRLHPEAVVSCGFSPCGKIRTNHFRFDAHGVELLLVHGSRLCAVVRHKDKTLAYTVSGEYLYAVTGTLPFCLSMSIVSGMWSNR